MLNSTPTNESNITHNRTITADRLTKISIEKRIDPFAEFQWPDSICEDIIWMPTELLTTHGTEIGKTLSEEEIIKLS